MTSGPSLTGLFAQRRCIHITSSARSKSRRAGSARSMSTAALAHFLSPPSAYSSRPSFLGAPATDLVRSATNCGKLLDTFVGPVNVADLPPKSDNQAASIRC